MKHNELLEALEKFLKDYKIRISDEFVHQDSKELILHFIRDQIASAVEAERARIKQEVQTIIDTKGYESGDVVLGVIKFLESI